MEVEKFRGYVAAIVAAIAVVGGAVGAVYVWLAANDVTPPRELALIFGVMTGLIGSGSTFLFMSDAGSRAAHAAERSFSSGTAAGSALPDQVATPLDPAVAQSGAVPGGPPTPGPLDDATSPQGGS